MSTVALGTFELFDTSGTPRGFCEHCEHAPCVAGGRTFCTMRPRFIVASALRKECVDLLEPAISDRLWVPMRIALYAVADAARGRDVWADEALKDLGAIRDLLRKAIQ